MFLFFITAGLTAVFIHKDPTAFGLWVNPINIGSILGGILFGFVSLLCFWSSNGLN